MLTMSNMPRPKLIQILVIKLYSSPLSVRLYKPKPMQDRLMTLEKMKLAKVMWFSVYQDSDIRKRMSLPKYMAAKNIQNSINNKIR